MKRKKLNQKVTKSEENVIYWRFWDSLLGFIKISVSSIKKRLSPGLYFPSTIFAMWGVFECCDRVTWRVLSRGWVISCCHFLVISPLPIKLIKKHRHQTSRFPNIALHNYSIVFTIRFPVSPYPQQHTMHLEIEEKF